MMKTKTILKLTMVMIIPAFLSYIANLFASLEYWQNWSPERMLHLNHEFIFYVSLTGCISSAFIVIAMNKVLRYADNIDKLDKLEISYIDEKNKMKKARDKYTNLLSNSETETSDKKQILIAEVCKKYDGGEWIGCTSYISYDIDRLKAEIEKKYNVTLVKDEIYNFPYFTDGGFKYKLKLKDFELKVTAHFYDIV